MGKAKVLDNLGQGLYTVELDLGSVRKQQKIDALTFDIDELVAVRAELFENVAAARIDLASARAAYELAIDEYVVLSKAGDPNAADILEEPTRVLAEAADALRAAQAELQTNESDSANLERKRSRLESTPGKRILDAWCADYTTYLDPDDEVSTLEVPNEPQAVLVAPGGQTEQDAGNLMKTDFQSSAQAFYNAAIFPGWQRYIPTYRFGLVTAINSDLTLSVDLELANSTAQNLPVNDVDSLANVPVAYQSCNTAAFRVGDRVLVEFRDRLWSNPRVIGFKSNPLPCPGGAISRVTGATVTRKAYPVATSGGIVWTAPTTEQFLFGDIGWGGREGGVSWSVPLFPGDSMYVYHNNVDYDINALFSDLYFFETSPEYGYCLPVILGAAIVDNVIVVAVETEAYTLVGGEEVYQEELYRFDLLGIVPRGFEDDPETTERYIIHQIQREAVMYSTTADMVSKTKEPEGYPDPPPATKSYTITTNVGAANCQGFSIKPDGTEFVYCNHTGAYHVTLSTGPTGRKQASHTLMPSTLEAWERHDYDFNYYNAEVGDGRKSYEYFRTRANVSGLAIVGAVWDGDDPVWIYYSGSGSQDSSSEATFDWFEDWDNPFFSSVSYRNIQLLDQISINLQYIGAVSWQMGQYTRALDRNQEATWIPDPDNPTTSKILSSLINHTDAYSVSGEIDELATYVSPGATQKAVEVPPESGVYVADRIITSGKDSATSQRVVVEPNGKIIRASGATQSADELSKPAEFEEEFPSATDPVVFPWFVGSSYGPLDQAPAETFDYYGTVAFINEYVGYWQRDLDPFRMHHAGRYWYRPYGVVRAPAYKSAVMGNAVILSTTINGQPFNYATGNPDFEQLFNATAPVAFNYIVAG